MLWWITIIICQNLLSMPFKRRENGHLVYACTGRSRAEMPEFIWDIGLDSMIGGNGSYVEHHGQVVMHQLIQEDEARRIVDWLHERGLEFYLESNNGLFASEHFRNDSSCFAPICFRQGENGKRSCRPRSRGCPAWDCLWWQSLPRRPQ